MKRLSLEFNREDFLSESSRVIQERARLRFTFATVCPMSCMHPVPPIIVMRIELPCLRMAYYKVASKYADCLQGHVYPLSC